MVQAPAMRRALLVVMFALCGCSPKPTCAIDLADSGCVTRPECVDAGQGLECSIDAQRCTVCVPSYHSFVADCLMAPDGGLRWSVSRGVPPPGCPPTE